MLTISSPSASEIESIRENESQICWPLALQPTTLDRPQLSIRDRSLVFCEESDVNTARQWITDNRYCKCRCLTQVLGSSRSNDGNAQNTVEINDRGRHTTFDVIRVRRVQRWQRRQANRSQTRSAVTTSDVTTTATAAAAKSAAATVVWSHSYVM